MPRLYDRSRVTTDWRCKRRRYLNYEHNGTGITSGTAAYELFFGTVVHDALATIANFHIRDGVVPITDICKAAYDQIHDTLLEQLGNETYATEQGWLIRGLIAGFYQYRWPRLLELYPTVIVVEQEVLWENFMVKPDLIMQSAEGTLVYIEYKTTGSNNEKWINSWETNPQLHVYMKAIKESLKLDVDVAVVVPLYKGSNYKGIQNSPFCYGYMRPGQPPFYEADISYSYKAGYKKHPVYTLTDNWLEWVDNMSDDLLAEQFFVVPPVYLNETIANNFFRQAALREGEIDMALKLLRESPPEHSEGIMDAFFPQNMEACLPSFGSSCPYADICVHGASPDDPLIWQPRQPHHGPEIEQRTGEQVV